MKNALLAFATIGTIGLYVLFNTRSVGLCEFDCGDWINKTQDNLLFFPVILFFSFLTYFMHSMVFNTWWKFARIAIPIIFIISILINLKVHHGPSGGFLNMDNMFDIPALMLMYSIFIVGSFLQIYRGYLQK